MLRKQRKLQPWRRFGYVILIIIKSGELLLWFSPRIINGLRSYIKHSKGCFIRYPNTLKLVKKNSAAPRFLNHFSVFGYRIKHSSSCLIYYIRTWRWTRKYRWKYKTLQNKNTDRYIEKCDCDQCWLVTIEGQGHCTTMTTNDHFYERL